MLDIGDECVDRLVAPHRLLLICAAYCVRSNTQPSRPRGFACAVSDSRLDSKHLNQLLLRLAMDRGDDLDIGFESRTAELLFEQGIELEHTRGVEHLDRDPHRL